MSLNNDNDNDNDNSSTEGNMGSSRHGGMRDEDATRAGFVGPDGFDEAAFDLAYDRAAKLAAEQVGFATEPGPIKTLTKAERLSLARARVRAANELVTDVQQWLVDDDPEVRKVARLGLEDVLRRVYTGDRNPREQCPNRRIGPLDRPILAVDRLVARLWDRGADPDGPDASWKLPRAQQRLRSLLIAMTLLSAIATAATLSAGWFWPSVALLVLTATVDVLEGSFARVSANRSAGLRWFSCVSSQTADMIILSSLALLATSQLLGAAVLIALLGAFIRVSALQAGRRLWASPEERVLRHSAVLGFLLLAAMGHTGTGTLLAATLVAASGAHEMFLAIRGVLRGPKMEVGELVFVEATAADRVERLHRCSLNVEPGERHELVDDSDDLVGVGTSPR